MSPLKFEQALDAAREADGRAKVKVTLSACHTNGIIHCFTGILHYSNKKQEEYIREETLSTITGQPLQGFSFVTAINPENKEIQSAKGKASSEAEFSISNNLVENCIGLFKPFDGENRLHLIKFEEKENFLVGVEAAAGNDTGDVLYTVAFTGIIPDPSVNTSTHFLAT